MRNSKIAITLFLIISAVSSAQFDNGRVWYPEPFHNIYAEIDFHNNLYLLSYLSSEFATSTDGNDWTLHCSPNLIQDFAYGNGLFVVIGLNGTILTSPDGQTWVESASNTEENLRHIIFDGSRFYIAGEGTMVRGDGATWTPFDLGLPIIYNDVAYNGSTYVIVGDDGAFWHSNNGFDWTVEIITANTGNRDINRVAFHEGRWLAGTSSWLLSGTIGGSWTADSQKRSARDFEMMGNDLLAVIEDRLFVRDTAGTWTDAPAFPSKAYTAAAYDGSHIFTCGFDAFLGSGETINNIQPHQPDLGPNAHAGLVTNGQLVISTVNGIQRSTDLINWVQTNPATISFPFWDGSRFVLYSTNGTVLTGDGNGVWLTAPTSFTATIKAMAFDGTTYVAVGDFGVASATSPEDLTIRPITVTSGKAGASFEMTHIVHDGTNFYAIGENSTLTLKSTDGITWSAQQRNNRLDAKNLFFFRDTLITWDGAGLWTSENGIDWTLVREDNDSFSKAWCCEHGCLGDGFGGFVALNTLTDEFEDVDISLFQSYAYVCLDSGHFLTGDLEIRQIWRFRYGIESFQETWPETPILDWINDQIYFDICN